MVEIESAYGITTVNPKEFTIRFDLFDEYYPVCYFKSREEMLEWIDKVKEAIDNG